MTKKTTQQACQDLSDAWDNFIKVLAKEISRPIIFLFIRNKR